MDPKTMNHIATATTAAIGFGFLAYAQYQERKLNRIIEAGTKSMAETKFTIYVPSIRED